MLELTKVSKSFRGSGGVVQALDDVSLRVEGGEFVAVRGPSGSGKSTLLLAAGGLLHADAGSVRLDGQDPYAMAAEKRAAFLARTVGFVFQRFHLIPYLSVLDNVLLPAAATEIPDARARATELLSRLGLSPRLGHVPAQLSTGERQRTALARAMLARPKLILADEPTGNLDPDNGRVVLQALAEFTAGGGAVLLVTHDPAAAAYAHRSLLLERGRLRTPTAPPLASV